jgi:peptidyl-tRNA hydrolase, PTH1 family
MKYLIVGLGNIGAEYAHTRHNIGFMLVDELARREKAVFQMDRLAYVTSIKYKGRSLELIKPTTYMNLSGRATAYWLQQLQIKTENLLVIVDDLALPFATLRMRAKGSHAGHNGLKDIEASLQSADYARLRFGIGSNFPRGRQADFVLSPFTAQENAQMPELLDKCCEMVYAYATIGIEKTMSLFNK